MSKDLETLLKTAKPSELVGVKPGRSACEVEFTNNCPASWKATIINIGAKFWFQDPAGNIVDEQVVSRVANIPTGGKDHITSQEGCARIVLSGCTVEVGGKTQTLTDQAQGTVETCLIKIPLIVGPKREAPRDEKFPIEIYEER